MPIVFGHLVIIVLCVCIAAFLLTRKSAKETVYFIALCLYITVYTFGNAMLLLSDSVPGVVAALQVENIGIPAIAPFFLLSILQLCDPRALRRWMGFAAIIYASLITIAILFNGYHHLYYTHYDITFGIWPMATLGKGALYFANQVIVILCFIVACWVLIRRLFVWTKRVRRQMSLIIAGSIVTLAGNIINVLGLLPFRLDVVVYACGVTAVLFFICILSNRLYDLVPMASELAIETMDDAMIVLDEDASYLFSNAAALSIFPDLTTLTIASPISKVTGWPDALNV